MAKRKRSVPPDHLRCRDLIRTCRSCGRRFEKSDKIIKCPTCGEDRRCLKERLENAEYCRQHGAKAGRQPTFKMRIAQSLGEAYNRLYHDPDLWEMVESQVLLKVRLEQLNLRLDEISAEGIDVEAVMGLIQTIRSATSSGDKSDVYNACTLIEGLLSDRATEFYLWRQIYEVMRMLGWQSKEQRTLILKSDEMIHANEVIEFMLMVIGIIFTYVPDTRDREAALDEISSAMPAPSQVNLENQIVPT